MIHGQAKKTRADFDYTKKDSNDSSKNFLNSIKRLLSHYSLRYHVCALVFAYVLVNNFVFITKVEQNIILSMLHFIQIPSFILDGNLYIGNNNSPTLVLLSVYTQFIFFTFFAIVAITARINFQLRAKFLLFGLISFVAFITVQFLILAILFSFHDFVSSSTFRVISILATSLVGALIVETALFSSIKIPRPTKLKRLINRSYAKEYAYLGITITISSLVLYYIITLFLVDTYSPLFEIIHITLFFNIYTIIFLGYFLSNALYEVRWPNWLKEINNNNNTYNDKKKESNNHNTQQKELLSISFLVPAYNEEKIVGRCIESIDRAASKYAGKTEIILINDGSTDNTEKIVAEAMRNLRYASGQFFTLPNSGKGFALVYGLKRTTGDVIFRTDADSVMDENVIGPMMNHFHDPQVGSVSGWIFPIEYKSLLQKAQTVLTASYFYTKRGQEIFDSIITQPGPSTAFRREAVLKAGGWIDNIFGEDGEITNRIARLGYRGDFEQRSIVYTEHPESLVGFLQQRARWSVAFYHSRGRNLRLVREWSCTRSVLFLWNLMAHGLNLAKSLTWSLFGVAILMGSITLSDAGLYLVMKLAAIQLIITTMLLILYGYRLNHMKKVGALKYFPFIRIINLILNMIIKPQVMEILLSWSTKWKEYEDDSFRDLRKQVNRSVDPLYPAGDYSAATRKS